MIRLTRFIRMVRMAPQMLQLLVEIEDQFSTRVFYDYGRQSRQWHLMSEAARVIRAAGGKVIGDDE